MINWERVNELKSEIGEKDFAEVAELFLQEVEEVILRLKTAPKPGLFVQDMHFLRSSSLNLGFDKLSKLCGNGEREAAAGNYDSVPLTAVFQAYDASKQAFLSGS